MYNHTEYMREWRKKNPGKAAEIAKRWRERNPEKVKESNHQQYLKRKAQKEAESK